MQVVQNGLAGSVEIASQVAASNIGNQPSHESSEVCSFIFAKPAIKEFRLAQAKYMNEDLDESDMIDLNLDLAPKELNLQIKDIDATDKHFEEMNFEGFPIHFDIDYCTAAFPTRSTVEATLPQTHALFPSPYPITAHHKHHVANKVCRSWSGA